MTDLVAIQILLGQIEQQLNRIATALETHNRRYFQLQPRDDAVPQPLPFYPIYGPATAAVSTIPEPPAPTGRWEPPHPAFGSDQW